MYHLWFLFGILSIAYGLQNEQFETFVGDIIDTWKLTLPTILYDDEAPGICYADQRVLCLMIKENEQMMRIDHNETGMSQTAVSTQNLHLDAF